MKKRWNRPEEKVPRILFYICSICLLWQIKRKIYLLLKFKIMGKSDVVLFIRKEFTCNSSHNFSRCHPWLDLLDLFLFAPIGASIGPSPVVIRVLSNRCGFSVQNSRFLFKISFTGIWILLKWWKGYFKTDFKDCFIYSVNVCIVT